MAATQVLIAVDVVLWVAVLAIVFYLIRRVTRLQERLKAAKK